MKRESGATEPGQCKDKWKKLKKKKLKELVTNQQKNYML